MMLLGYKGMVGRAFGEYDLIRFDRCDLDVNDYNELREVLLDIRPNVLINCTGITDIYRCEKNPAEAYRVNVAGVINIASACIESETKLIQFSSLFSGGSNIYTKTKALMENILPKITDNFLVIRLPWLFGRWDCKFQSTVIKCLKDDKVIPVYIDELGSPTYINDVAKFVMNRYKDLSGIISVANDGNATRQEWAEEIAINLKYKLTGFKPVVRKLLMPSDSRIETSQYPRYILRNWRGALAECLEQDNSHLN